MKKKIKIGTRGSKLALWQANFIKNEIGKYDQSIEAIIEIIQTQGDRDQASSLTQIGGQGLFTKALEQALFDNKIDLAVHSLKDLPSDMPDSLCLGAVPKRGPVADVFIGLNESDFYKLPENACIACGSIRRRSQLLAIRPQINFVDLRGNINTRLNKLKKYGYDGIIMAEAALVRLKLNNVFYSLFSITDILPAVGQGAIGVQVRKEDNFLQPLLDKMNDPETFQSVSAERAFLHTLDSGCQFPVAAYAEIEHDKIKLHGLVANLDGSNILKETQYGNRDYPEKTGIQLAETLISRGAKTILKEI